MDGFLAYIVERRMDNAGQGANRPTFIVVRSVVYRVSCRATRQAANTITTFRFITFLQSKVQFFHIPNMAVQPMIVVFTVLFSNP